MTASKQSWWTCNCSSNMTLPGSGHQNLHETYQCRMYSGKLMMMAKVVARNMYNFITEQIWIISASDWLLKRKNSSPLWPYEILNYFSRDRTKLSFPSFSRTFQNFPSISDLLCEESNFQDHAKPHSECSVLALKSTLLAKRGLSFLNAVFAVAILNLISRVDLTFFVTILPNQLKYCTFFRCF